MRKNVTYISFESFMGIASDLGLAHKENAGFVQISLGNGYHAYVARTKRVGRVDLQFLPTGEGYEDLGEAKFGRIVAQVDFSRPEPEVLEAFARALLFGMKLPTWVKPKQSPREAASLPVQSPTDRRALIEKASREMGVEISPRA